MNDKDDKNLNINTGRDFIYTITHGVGAIWLTLIIAIIVGGIVGGSIWYSNNQELKNQQLQEANKKIFQLEKEKINFEIEKLERDQKLLEREKNIAINNLEYALDSVKIANIELKNARNEKEKSLALIQIKETEELKNKIESDKDAIVKAQALAEQFTANGFR